MSVVMNRDLLSKGASAAIGIALALQLSHMLGPKRALILPEPPKPMSVSVRMAALPPKGEPVTAVEKELRLKTDKPVAAPKPKKPRPVPAPPKNPPEKQEPKAEDSASPVTSLPTIVQPSLTVPAAPPVANLPTIGAPDVPEAPPEAPPEDLNAKVYAEKPGGDTLVLGLLLNDQGKVIDSQILVPSYNTLTDIAVSMASIGQTWTNLQPPLAPGETRWIELRIPFVETNKPTSLLP